MIIVQLLSCNNLYQIIHPKPVRGKFIEFEWVIGCLQVISFGIKEVTDLYKDNNLAITLSTYKAWVVAFVWRGHMFTNRTYMMTRKRGWNYVYVVLHFYFYIDQNKRMRGRTLFFI